MQIIIEGLAMAASGNLHQAAQEPLMKQLIKYVFTRSLPRAATA